MNLSEAVLENIAKRYNDQRYGNTEIVLEKNVGNTGGHCHERTFIKGVIYKVILPVPLISPENYVLEVSSGEGGSYKIFNHAEKIKILTEYECDINSFFLLFKEITTCRFFTNRIPHN